MTKNKFEKDIAKTFNLQLFAEGGEGAEKGAEKGAEEGAEEGAEKGAEDENKIDFSKEQQAEIDRQISKSVDNALKKYQSKAEKEKLKAIEKAKNDAIEYAKLTAEEKQEADLQEKIDNIEAREKAINQKELLNNIKADLNENGLPSELAESLVVIEDNEKIKENIKSIKEIWDSAIKEEVKKALSGKSPKLIIEDKKAMTKGEIMKIKDSFARQKAIAENIELFR